MSKAEELWKKYAVTDAVTKNQLITSWAFEAALHEYGALVRKRDAEVCKTEENRLYDIGFNNEAYTASVCAAAIEREPLQ